MRSCHKPLQDLQLTLYTHLRSLVLTSENMKFIVFWDMTLCSLVESCQCFTGLWCHHLQGRKSDHPTGLMMEAAGSSYSYMLVPTTRLHSRHIPQDSTFPCLTRSLYNFTHTFTIANAIPTCTCTPFHSLRLQHPQWHVANSYEEYDVQGCNTMYFRGSPTFGKEVSPPPLGSMWKLSKHRWNTKLASAGFLLG
jgi:hypothetical protein